MALDNTALALFGLIAWTIVLLIGIAGVRASLVLTNKREANSFAPSGEDVSALSGRLCRAHANCYEFLPLALAVLLYAIATDQTGITNGLALIVLLARLAQSITHILSTSALAVNLRFALLIPQIGILLFWMASFAGWSA